MMISGQLNKDEVLIKKPKDIGRLFNKSNFGRMLPGETLSLNLIEAIFLLTEEKIKIKKDNEQVSFEEILKTAVEKIDRFEIKFLVFKDLRKRGHQIRNCVEFENVTFTNDFKNSNEKKFYIKVFSERDIFDIKDIERQCRCFKDLSKNLWFGIVDEEGDTTYYDVSLATLKGSIKKNNYQSFKGIIMDNRVCVLDKEALNKLYEKEFFGKPFGKLLQISFVEALYLVKKGFLELKDANENKISSKSVEKELSISQSDLPLRYIVYNDLKNKGLIVKTGFKFGAHFRAYTNNPNLTHAEHLIHVVDKDFKSNWSDISRAVRIAHSVNKDIIFARIIDKNIEYIRFGRLRP